MKWMFSLVICLMIIFLAAQTIPKKDAVLGENPYELVDTVFNQQAAIAAIQKSIEGRENEPAEDVFGNIQTFMGMPAGRIVRIMEFGIARSLGVDCTHCHNPLDWKSDEISAKKTTREMFAMVGRINGELLPEIEGLKGRATPAVVNCTTCHRGNVVPATNMN